jgi:hypothetical protein
MLDHLKNIEKARVYIEDPLGGKDKIFETNLH